MTQSKRSKTTKPKRVKSTSKPIKPSRATDESLWREALNESVAGVTDSIFTQFALTMCYFLYTQNDGIQKYFHSGTHIYWLSFYFFHLNILDSHIWGKTFRNSLVYLYTKPKQNVFRTIFVIVCQYISIFGGVWLSIRFVEYMFNEDPTVITQLKHMFVGVRNGADTWTDYHYIQFIGQATLFLLADRLIAAILVTLSPLIKRTTFILDGKWTLVTLRIILKHYLIVTENPVGIIVNPNYGFYANLYYWRWSRVDIIILILPYLSIPIWNATFAKLSILQNPTYFQPARLAEKKQKKQ